MITTLTLMRTDPRGCIQVQDQLLFIKTQDSPLLPGL